MALPTLAFLPSKIVPTEEQRRIQGSRSRITLVQANAGAAKTTTLALRVAEAVARGIAPERILALTFTTQASEVLRARLVDIGMAAAVARRLTIMTVDQFAASVLSQREDGEIPPTLDDEGFREQMLAALEGVAEHGFSMNEPFEIRTHNVALNELQTRLATLKATMALDLDPDTEDMSRADVATTLGLPLVDYLAILEYEQLRLGSFDRVQFRAPNDASYDLARLLRAHPDERPAAGRFDLVVADELHDLNEATFRILHSLLQDATVHFVGAGDRDQVIQSQLGADDRLLTERFHAEFNECVALPLTVTWRHGPHLAFAMQAFKSKPVRSLLSLHTRIDTVLYDTADDCARQVALAVQQWRDAARKPASVAILLRERHQSVAIENALMQAGVDYHTEAMPGYLAREEILFLRGMMAIAAQDLAAVASESARREIVSALAWFAEVALTPADLAQAQRDIAAEPALLAHFYTGQILRTGSLHGRVRIEQAVTALRALEDDAPAQTALDMLCRAMEIETVARRLYLAPDEAAIVAQSIDGFLAIAAQSGMDRHAFARWLGSLDQPPSRTRARQTVLLDRVGHAKGKEFDHVLLPYLQIGEFPRRAAPPLDEENLFYVAATRAKARLSLFMPRAENAQSPFVSAMQLAAHRAQAEEAVRNNAARARAGLTSQAGGSAATPTHRASPVAKASTASGSAHTTAQPGERIDLRVSYADKDIVKGLGALWNPVRKTWYVKAGMNPAPFSGWFRHDSR